MGGPWYKRRYGDFTKDDMCISELCDRTRIVYISRGFIHCQIITSKGKTFQSDMKSVENTTYK